ncbi:putative pathogenesis-related protein CaO19.6200 [Bidens hawaiensis]|uniref:putative pathogenesis-related protein CaO19.6200 n=1 Tax=Bidens hawaiensis TaxID=980011 RepID=UPI00404B39DE
MADSAPALVLAEKQIMVLPKVNQKIIHINFAFLYTQNAPEDNVNVHNVARKEVGFYTSSGPGGANNAPTPGVDDNNVTCKREDFERAHNVVRKEHGLGPVTWNDTIAEFAQNFAEKRRPDCAIIHSMGDKGYAENVAMGGTAQDALNMWCSKKEFYDAATKTCQPGKECGHYLEVIAKEGIQIGCGRAKCANIVPRGKRQIIEKMIDWCCILLFSCKRHRIEKTSKVGNVIE